MKNRTAVVLVHGLSKKPPVQKLEELWLWGLSRGNPMPDVFAPPNPGINLASEGIPAYMNYYADVFYGVDFDTDLRSYFESDLGLEADLGNDGLMGLDQTVGSDLLNGITPREQRFLLSFLTKLEFQAETARVLSAAEPKPVRTGCESASGCEIAGWLPEGVRQAIIKKAAMEAYYFLFDKEYTQAGGQRVMVRQELRNRLLSQLVAASKEAERVVVVSHSMGTMVAYDVLRNCPDCPPVDTLFTLGSPLGVREVQDELIARDQVYVDFPADKLSNWINIYDPLDPICGTDPRFANDYRPAKGKSVVDIKESNWGSWRHSITHYLAGTRFRAELAKATGISLDKL